MRYLNTHFGSTNFSIVWILFTQISVANSIPEQTPCPIGCHCTLLSDRTATAVCRLGNHSDYTAVTRLPSNTTDLVCVVSGKLDEHALQLRSLRRLRKLVIRPEKLTSFLLASYSKKTSEIKRHDLLQNLSSLESLAIHIPLWFLTPRLLDPVPNLKFLDLSHSYLHIRGKLPLFLHKMTLTGHRLQTVNVSAVQRRHTTTVPDPILLRDDIFSSLESFPIKVLDVLDNEIVALQAGMSAYLPELEVLRVGSRRLMYIQGGPGDQRSCYHGELLWHPTLRELFLRFPDIRDIDNSKMKRSVTEKFAFQPSLGSNVGRCVLDALLQPSFNFCRIANCICQDVIHIPCVRLPKVRISDLLDFKDGCYNNFRIPLPPHLERLTMQNRLLPGIPDNKTISNVIIPELQGTTIKICFYPHNNLRYLDLSTYSVGVGRLQLSFNISLVGLRKLEFCNLQGNAVFITPQYGFFSDMPLLKVLLLGGNLVDLYMWEHLDFLHLPSLESLDLKRCLLGSIPPLAFSRLEYLRYLNLSDNEIDAINITLGRHLRRLDLSENEITSLPQEMTAKLDNIAQDHSVSLDLSGNPLRCFCDEANFVNWLKSTKVTFENKQSTFCTHPTLSRVSPWDVDTEALHLLCIHFTAIISSISTAVGVSVLIGTLMILYKRRWRIRFWIYTAREMFRKKHSRETEGYHRLRDFKYDAFVAYSSHGDERSWVHMTLREKLEDEHGLKLCMYHRDFMVGRDLADTIVEGINSSDKTLLILSPAFLQSGWCEFEVRMAKEKLMTERRDSLIIVLYSQLDRPSAKFPKSLARLLDKKIYIEWTDDPEGQKIFWRRLVEAIRNDNLHDGFAGCSVNAD